MTITVVREAPRGSMARRLSAALWRRPWLGLGSLLAPPLAWVVLIYLAALVVLFIAAFWSVDAFTGEMDETWTLDNFRAIASSATYGAIALRTVLMAAAVTATDAVLAYPFAYTSGLDF